MKLNRCYGSHWTHSGQSPTRHAKRRRRNGSNISWRAVRNFRWASRTSRQDLNLRKVVAKTCEVEINVGANSSPGGDEFAVEMTFLFSISICSKKSFSKGVCVKRTTSLGWMRAKRRAKYAINRLNDDGVAPSVSCTAKREPSQKSEYCIYFLWHFFGEKIKATAGDSRSDNVRQRKLPCFFQSDVSNTYTYRPNFLFPIEISKSDLHGVLGIGANSMFGILKAKIHQKSGSETVRRSLHDKLLLLEM